MREPAKPMLVLAAAAVLAACSTVPSPTVSRQPDPTPTSSAVSPSVPSPDPAAELDRLPTLLEAIHPDPWHGIGRSEFVAELAAYRDRLPQLSPSESVVELMRVWALLSREGRDGHQYALPTDSREGPMLPLRVYEFDDGMWVTDALPPHADLVGTRIVGVGGRPIGEVLAAIAPLVPRDGPATVPAHRPILFLRTMVLRGLGIIGADPVVVRVADASGVEREVSLAPISLDEHEEWAGRFGTSQLPVTDGLRYLAGSDAFSAEALDGGRAVYLRYRFVTGADLDEARRLLAEDHAERLILDLRQNPGGDNNTYGRLLRLVQGWAEQHPGATFVITDQFTFSAAANLTSEIEQSTDAAIVGGAMGGSPNLYGDVSWIDLTALPVPMRVAIATRYWQMSTPDDERLTIEPDLPVAITGVDYFAGRDPVLDSVLAAPIDGSLRGR